MQLSHLWTKEQRQEQHDSAWGAYPLESDIIRLAADGPAPLGPRQRLSRVSDPVLMRTRATDGRESFLLLIQPRNGTRVNGQRVIVGARVLSDRDLIALGGGQRLWFSSEQTAEVAPFEGEPAGCIRCKLRLEPGTPAVRCPAPGCGFWHHQSEDLPCWTYTDGCAACGYPTDLDAGYQWSPDKL